LRHVGLESSAAGFLTNIEVGTLTRILAILGLIDGVLDLAQAVRSSLLPALVGPPAQITGAGGYTLRVEAGFLVERHDMRGVRRTEDMTAVTTVVTAQENTKGRATGGRITVG
jgi:hypothetical protein